MAASTDLRKVLPTTVVRYKVQVRGFLNGEPEYFSSRDCAEQKVNEIAEKGSSDPSAKVFMTRQVRKPGVLWGHRWVDE